MKIQNQILNNHKIMAKWTFNNYKSRTVMIYRIRLTSNQYFLIEIQTFLSKAACTIAVLQLVQKHHNGMNDIWNKMSLEIIDVDLHIFYIFW